MQCVQAYRLVISALLMLIALLLGIGADGLFMVVDERGVFKDDSFQAAVAALQDSNAAAATSQSGKGGSKGDKKQPKQVRPRALLWQLLLHYKH